MEEDAVSTVNKGTEAMEIKFEDKEIEEMAKKIKERNKMAASKNTVVAQTPTKKDSPLAHSKTGGCFGWAEICSEGPPIPYILRGDLKLVSVLIFNSMIGYKYTKFFTNEVLDCMPTVYIVPKREEIDLLNEINIKHSDFYFGKELFTTRDVFQTIEDCTRRYQFLKYCYSTLLDDDRVNQEHGFISIDKQHLVPFITCFGEKHVPLFYFEGESNYLDGLSVRLTGWDLSYLRFLCKVQQIKKSLYHGDSVAIVSLQELKKLFPPNTTFENKWPKNVNGDLLRKKMPIGIANPYPPNNNFNVSTTASANKTFNNQSHGVRLNDIQNGVGRIDTIMPGMQNNRNPTNRGFVLKPNDVQSGINGARLGSRQTNTSFPQNTIPANQMYTKTNDVQNGVGRAVNPTRFIARQAVIPVDKSFMAKPNSQNEMCGGGRVVTTQTITSAGQNWTTGSQSYSVKPNFIQNEAWNRVVTTQTNTSIGNNRISPNQMYAAKSNYVVNEVGGDGNRCIKSVTPTNENYAAKRNLVQNWTNGGMQNGATSGHSLSTSSNIPNTNANYRILSPMEASNPSPRLVIPQTPDSTPIVHNGDNQPQKYFCYVPAVPYQGSVTYVSGKKLAGVNMRPYDRSVTLVCVEDIWQKFFIRKSLDDVVTAIAKLGIPIVEPNADQLKAVKQFAHKKFDKFKNTKFINLKDFTSYLKQIEMHVFGSKLY